MIQSMHLDNHDDHTYEFVLDTPLYELANASSHLLEDHTFELSPAHIKDKVREEHITYFDTEPCLKGSIPQKYLNSFA